MALKSALYCAKSNSSNEITSSEYVPSDKYMCGYNNHAKKKKENSQRHTTR